MTQYLMSVHGAHTDNEIGGYASREEAEEAFAATGVFNQKLMDEGYWVFAGGLAAPSTATVVDNRGEEAMVTDGPFLESKEFLAGFWILEAADLDTVLKLAAEGSKACNRKIEVRPFL
jgi:hypothetical protein